MRQVVLEQYGIIDLFSLLIDRDGKIGRRDALKRMENSLQPELEAGRCFIAVCAYQEVEVWAIAGTNYPKTWRWNDARSHPNPKEEYFEPLVYCIVIPHHDKA